MGWLKDLGRGALAVSTFGASELANEATGGGVYGEGSRISGKLKDILGGKKDPGRPDRMIELDPSLKATVEQGRAGQQQGLGLYTDELTRLKGVSPEKLAGVVQARQEKQLLGQGADQQRRAQQLIAQRGLSRSSVGLNAMLGADKQTRENIATARAEAPLMQEKIASQRLAQVGQATGGINQVLNAQGAQRDLIQGRQGGTRSGGLLGLAMGAGGAYLAGQAGGNPMAGFQAGQGAGQGLANL